MMAEHTQTEVENQLKLKRIEVNKVHNDISKAQQQLLNYEQQMNQSELTILRMENELLHKLEEFTIDHKEQNVNVESEINIINAETQINVPIQCHQCLHEIYPNIIDQTIYINEKDIKVLCSKCFSDISETETANNFKNWKWNKNEQLDIEFNNKFRFAIMSSIVQYGIGPTLSKISQLLELQSKLQQKENLKYIEIDKIFEIGSNDIDNDTLNEIGLNDTTHNIIARLPNVNDIADILSRKNRNSKSEMEEIDNHESQQITQIEDDIIEFPLQV